MSDLQPTPRPPAPDLVWSPTGAAAYGECPRAWAHRYGPDRPQRGGGGQLSHEKIRGIAVHAGLAAAYLAAAAAGETNPVGTLARHHVVAREAMGRAWGQAGETDMQLARECIGLLWAALNALPLPASADVYAVERRLTGTSPAGVALLGIPDLALWLDRAIGHLFVRDWKTGTVEEDDVLYSQQLLIYAYLLTLADPAIERISVGLYSVRGTFEVTREVTAEQVYEAVARIERTADRAMSDREFVPRPGSHCAGCPAAAICPAIPFPAAVGAPQIEAP